jgi:hypothetical protein
MELLGSGFPWQHDIQQLNPAFRDLRYLLIVPFRRQLSLIFTYKMAASPSYLVPRAGTLGAQACPTAVAVAVGSQDRGLYVI